MSHSQVVSVALDCFDSAHVDFADTALAVCHCNVCGRLRDELCTVQCPPFRYVAQWHPAWCSERPGICYLFHQHSEYRDVLARCLNAGCTCTHDPYYCEVMGCHPVDVPDDDEDFAGPPVKVRCVQMMQPNTSLEVSREVVINDTTPAPVSDIASVSQRNARAVTATTESVFNRPYIIRMGNPWSVTNAKGTSLLQLSFPNSFFQAALAPTGLMNFHRFVKSDFRVNIRGNQCPYNAGALVFFSMPPEKTN
ncbi:MAG: hypothetical protein NWF07_15340 [Candidatus Bathyarchaeota archaeon]|nr:hypothetical protein [Candidatus Bathyarchaeota archaeon]